MAMTTNSLKTFGLQSIQWTLPDTNFVGKIDNKLSPNMRFVYCSKKKRMFFPVLFRATNVVWHCTSTRQRQTPCSMPHHTVPRQQQRPNSPLAFNVPKLIPKQTHLKRVGETCSRQSERPCRRACVGSGSQAGVGGHSSTGDS